ncbi:MAG: tRNA guanosine(34) transglycosylase Tgt [Chloroflexi bacterium]|nr:tRNA guanosine(34) transglycosylase Tgt [Chloroflexota bacterium]
MTVTFQLLAQDGAARRGRLVTTRAVVETPCFMPVGTLATVKTLRPEQVAALGYRLILANAFHLHLQPGEEVVAQLGGIQRMMGWEGAVLTDSGGFQVFSLADLREVDDEGVTFRTPLGLRRLTPERAMAIQRTLGSDIAMVLDDVPPITAPPAVQRAALERTHRWALRCLAEPPAPGQARFAIVQGGIQLAWRRESARWLGALPFEGFAIGGLSLGESKAQLWELTRAVTEELPLDRPRYLMGVGAPEDLVVGVIHGVDLFDCVLATRIARHGTVLTSRGQLSLKASARASERGPLDEGCTCPTCHDYSRGWLRHLFQVGEPLALRLATVHNLAFLARLMAQVRAAIEAGQVHAFARSYLDGLRRADLSPA